MTLEEGGKVTAAIDQVPTQDLESNWELSGDSLRVNVTATKEQTVYMLSGAAQGKQIELKEPEANFVVTLKRGSSNTSSTKYTIESFQDGRYKGTDAEGASWTITPQASNMISVTVTRDGLPPKLSTGTAKVVGSDLVFAVGFSSGDDEADYVITATDAVPGKRLSTTVAVNGTDAGSMTLTPTD